VQQYLRANYAENRGYFAASADLSIGAEFKINKRAAIRIAPYIQIPLKGMGVGALPLSVGGLHIGFTLPYSKR
jgi:hypothetical protein